MADLEAVELLLAEVFGSATDAIGISRDNVIRVVNARLLALFGYEHPEDVLGRTFLDLMTEDSRRQLLQHIRARADGTRVPGAYVATGVRRDGTHIPLDIRTTTFVHGDATYALAMLRSTQGDPAAELYEAVFTQNTAVKLLIDPSDGRIVDANQAAATFYGWSRETLQTMRISEINVLPPEVLRERMQAARAGSRTFFEFRHRTASGEERQVHVHTGPVQVAGRTLLLSILQDVSERESLEAQLRQARQLEAIGRLAGGVAHDFNNLLTIVTACAENVQDLTRDDPSVQRHLTDLRSAAHRAGDLIRELLAAGRRQPLQPVRVPLHRLVERMEPLIRRVLRDEVTLVIDVEPVSVSADPARLEQVLVNLVVNAGEATPRHGHVTVRVRSTETRGVLSVQDDGVGMDEETRARVFEPFFTTKDLSRGAGRGMGLASVYGIVTQSGGSIEVLSSPGEGATFVVSLPTAAQDAPTEAPVPLPSRPTRILILEDEEDLRTLLVDGLERHGFEVRAEPSGAEGLALSDADLHAFDVLVTDHVMPGPTGVDTARALAARHPPLRVLLISGNLPPGERSRLPPASTYLSKPFSLRQLIAAVDPSSGT